MTATAIVHVNTSKGAMFDEPQNEDQKRTRVDLFVANSSRSPVELLRGEQDHRTRRLRSGDRAIHQRHERYDARTSSDRTARPSHGPGTSRCRAPFGDL